MNVRIRNATIIGNENGCKLTGRTYYSYLGIPYAKPPIGELRFQPPVKADEIEEEFDGTVEAYDCIQMNGIGTGTTGSEDCLYLNVYVPKHDLGDGKSVKPVIVYVHGGIFTYMSGSSTNFSPDYLVSRDVIVVTINYRLHLFGFLDLALPECPGNMGLLDQIMAFKWVKDNIHYFGGDSNNITAFGTGAGAISIHLFAMSPLTKDMNLFHKIVSSSCNVITWPIKKENAQETAFELGHRLGYRGRNREALLKFLRSVPAEELAEKMNDYYLALKTERKGQVFCFPFLPTVQKLTEGAVIPEDPILMVKEMKKMPILTGLSDKDGLIGFFLEPFLMTYAVENLFSVLQQNLKIVDDIVPRVTNLVQSYYFQYKEASLDSFPEMVDQKWSADLTHDARNKFTFLIKNTTQYTKSFQMQNIYNKHDSTFEDCNEIMKIEDGMKLSTVNLNSVELLTDMLWLRCYYDQYQSQLISEDPAIYIFEFKYDGGLNCYKKYYPVLTRWIKGATQDDILGYCLPFKYNLASRFSSRRDLRVIKYICTFVCNFAATGNPNCDSIKTRWRNSTVREPCYLQISDVLKMANGRIKEKSIKLWERVDKIIKDREILLKTDVNVDN